MNSIKTICQINHYVTCNFVDKSKTHKTKSQTTNSIKTLYEIKHYVTCNCVGKSRTHGSLNFSHHSGNWIVSLLSKGARRQRQNTTYEFHYKGPSNETPCHVARQNKKCKHARTHTPKTQATHSIKTVCEMKDYIKCNSVGKAGPRDPWTFPTTAATWI